MEDIDKKVSIFKKLEDSFKNGPINSDSLDGILSQLNIKKAEFYFLFPNKIKSLCSFYFENIYLSVIKKLKKSLVKEKSISKKTTILVVEFIKLFDKKPHLSIYFLNYICLKPIFLSKTIYKISNNIWYDIGDKSIDISYYTKRIILFNIIKNSLFYWRNNQSIEDTLVFIERQVSFFGKLGKSKYNAKKYIKEKVFKKL